MANDETLLAPRRTTASRTVEISRDAPLAAELAARSRVAVRTGSNPMTSTTSSMLKSGDETMAASLVREVGSPSRRLAASVSRSTEIVASIEGLPARRSAAARFGSEPLYRASAFYSILLTLLVAPHRQRDEHGHDDP